MLKLDFNSDLGEGFGIYKLGMDEEMIECISSINCACGWHAGDPMIMDKTVRMCKEKGVAVGAHPGYPDMLGFGRRMMVLTYEEAKNYIKYQLGALTAFTQSHHVPLQHASIHGMMGWHTQPHEIEAFCDAIKEFNDEIIVLADAQAHLAKCAESKGLRVAHAGYADRAYNEDLTLVKRGTPGAMITDPEECVKRVVRMVKEGKVTAITGKDIDIKVHAITVHGDNKTAIDIIRGMRKSIEAEGIQIVPMGQIV